RGGGVLDRFRLGWNIGCHHPTDAMRRDPVIQGLLAGSLSPWIAGSSPAMTSEGTIPGKQKSKRSLDGAQRNPGESDSRFPAFHWRCMRATAWSRLDGISAVASRHGRLLLRLLEIVEIDGGGQFLLRVLG